MYQKITLLLTLVGLLTATTGNAQLSGYVKESFESTTFPPSGWIRTNVSGTNQWSRSTAEHHTGAASAWMSYQSTAGEDWLITPQFTAASTDSVTFWLLLDFAGYAPDSLSLKISTTDDQTTSFTSTILSLKEGTNYPANATTWYRYAVSLQQFAGQDIYIAFKHFNDDGDGLYIDDVTFGTPPPYDISTEATTVPDFVSNTTSPIGATIKNRGNFTETFNVTAQITPGGYASTQTITTPSAGTAPVTFTPWTPTVAGTYTLKIYPQLPADMDHTNDTLIKTLTVIDTFPEYGWESHTALPQGRWAHAMVYTKLCSDADTAFLYVISGNDASFAQIASVQRQNLVTGNWQDVAPIPGSRQQISAAELGGKIYVPGGYASSFAPNAALQIYDPATNSWSNGNPMPTAVGDYAIGTYADSLIYVIGGYNGSGDVNTVQIYNTHTNTWTTGTAFPGTAVAGVRMGIAGNKIIYAGGYSQTAAATLNQAWMGTIDPVNPALITWSVLPDVPIGPTGRFGGGAAFGGDRVYFTGGDPNGQGTSVLVQTFAFNTLTNAWETGPSKLTGVSNINNFTFALYEDSLYMVSTGGYDGVAVVGVNEWLNIGPYAAPTISNDTIFCDSGTVLLTATGGTAYDWMPAAQVNDSSAAATTSDVTATTTFDVTITLRYGCPVTKSVTATVNASAATSQSFDLCYGSSVTVGSFTHSASGTYNDTLATVNGCDSVVTTVLNIMPENSHTQNIDVCFGETYTIGTSTYNASGTYNDTLIAINGCDSIITTVLNIMPENSHTQNINVCFGETYTIGTSTYNASGTYNDTLIAVNGCDSIVTTVLNVLPENSHTQNINVCFGETYTIGTSTYNASGTYNDTLIAVNGCDSIVTTVLNVLPENSHTQNIDVCFGETYTIGTSTYNANGTYNDTLIAVNGCDSIVTTVLNVLPENSHTQNIDVCFGETYTIGTSTYNASGTYNDTLIAVNGCDSIVMTVLNVLPENSHTQNIDVCFGEMYTIGTSIYNASGTYNDTLTAVNGCDSVVVTVLTVGSQLISTFTVTGVTLTADQAGASYQWISCPSDLPVSGGTSQSFTPSQNGSYALIVSQNNCSDTSECFAITTIGIGELSEQQPMIYPNPNHGSFTLKAPAGGMYLLLNELGQQIMQLDPDVSGGQVTTVTGLGSGVYFVVSKAQPLLHQKVVVTN